MSQFAIGPEGVTLPADRRDPVDVYFDDQHVWSFAPKERSRARDSTLRVPWPRTMRSWLDGVAVVSLRQGGAEAYAEEVSFGSSTERIAFVDDRGIPVMIDKWGLIQRPFSGRPDDVVTDMLDLTEEIMAVLREELGIQCWLAFGSLLGAAREGKVIAHDSDVDLAYLSEKADPAEINQEMYAITRALRGRGLRVVNKTGAFITVLFDASDEGSGSIDVYACFHLGDLLYETATVRAPVPKSAILPLGELSFEGRMLPVPADVDTMLKASYGEGWRVPDPSFRHEPGPAINQRFDPWFGTLMKFRRDWERWLRSQTDDHLEHPSDFRAWVEERLPAEASVFDVGAGLGADSLAFGRDGHPVVGIDYIRGGFIRAGRMVREEELPIQLFPANLLSLRDCLAVTAVAAHSMPGPRAFYARELVDSLDPHGRSNLAQMIAMFGRPGDQVFVEFGRGGDRLLSADADPAAGGPRFATTVSEVAQMLRGAGVEIEEAGPAGLMADGRTRYRIAGRYRDRLGGTVGDT